MPVLRKNKKANYTVIDNHVFRNAGLSLKAKGLLCQMLSLPDNWEYSLEGLVTLASDGISSVRSALKELENQMYFKRQRLYKNGKLAGVEYIISETPMCENLILENLKQENLILENQAQLNTNNNQIKNKSNIYSDVPEELKEPFMEWVKMRKGMKKPIVTKQAVTRALNKLYKLADTTEKQIELIELATDKNWLGFYPKKKEEQSRRYKEFEPEQKIESVEMPEEIRQRINEIF